MSFKLAGHAWDADLPGMTKLVLLCLADTANDDGACWPATKTVANKCGMSRSTVNRHLDKLCSSGYLVKDKRRREDGGLTSNLYHITMPQNGQGCVRVTQGVVSERNKGCITVTQHEPITEPINKEPKTIAGESHKRFTPPSALEVDEYCQARDNGICGEVFVDFYEARGWQIGKNKMKDWKAAVRTWESRRKEQQPKEPLPKPKSNLPTVEQINRVLLEQGLEPI